MTSSLVSPQTAAPPTPKPWRPGWFSKFFAFTPIWFWIIANVGAPRFSEPMFVQPPAMFGIPAGVLLAGLVVFWMLMGAFVLWSARSRRVAAIAYTAFTFPATVALILGPALILIWQNLG